MRSKTSRRPRRLPPSPAAGSPPTGSPSGGSPEAPDRVTDAPVWGEGTAQRRPSRRQGPSEDALIWTRGLTKTYGERVAVDHLDLEVRPGEIFGLLGQNGAGKTTTILMLLGLTEPTDGEARVLGLDPARHPLGVKSRVGYLPDAVGFYGTMTGRQNLRYTARLNGLARDEVEDRIAAVLEQVGLADRADGRTDTYSRGMLQRLGIADALLKDPEILILDEPTTAIDPIGVVEILALLRSLVDERGMAILLSSHLLTQVQSVCDRVGIFAAGQLIGVGTVDELAARFGDGAAHLEVAFSGSDVDRKAVETVLTGIRGVESVVPGVAPTDPWRVLVRPAGDGQRVRSELLAACVAAGLPLTTLREIEHSLDAIYRRAAGRTGARAGEVAA
jgi:ABC-2 type transport system ATP-binding protein